MTGEEVRPIDVHHLGYDRVICAWLVGEVIVDPGPASAMDALLEGLGDLRPRAVALTHIHLDHAGATGSLVRRWPEVEVWVHSRGAPHMVDPSRLIASARRLYGDQMEALWGEIAPVPRANLRVLEGGEQCGPFTVAYTPGHAKHHLSYWHQASGRAFVGDVAGVRIPPSSCVLAPTPPPDIDLKAWAASLELVEAWHPRSLGLTHFGAIDDPPAHLARMREALAHWAERAGELDEPAFARLMAAEVGAVADPRTAARYTRALPPDQSWHGLHRYRAKLSSEDER